LGKEIKIKIDANGKVEVEASVFTDCTEVANHLAKVLGKVESLTVKDEHEDKELIKIER
jgi:hypothetical protein